LRQDGRKEPIEYVWGITVVTRRAGLATTSI
jgi:hypothetical protein